MPANCGDAIPCAGCGAVLARGDGATACKVCQAGGSLSAWIRSTTPAERICRGCGMSEAGLQLADGLWWEAPGWCNECEAQASGVAL